MSAKRDSDGFVPPRPVSTRSQSVTPSGVSDSPSRSNNSGVSLVQNYLYRDSNLVGNKILMAPLRTPLPGHITSVIDRLDRDRGSLAPTEDQIKDDDRLNSIWLGVEESEIEEYFKDNVFPLPEPSGDLKRTIRFPMARRIVPDNPEFLKNISNPVPDMLYGYDRHKVFHYRQPRLIAIGDEMVGNSQGLVLPFFAIELKGEGPSVNGNLWVATNQCLGGSSSCVNVAERFNLHLMHSTALPIQTTAFSIAMSGTEARLYVTWIDDDRYYQMASVRNFLLHDPKSFLEFRKYVHNIVDWGKGERLTAIRAALDVLAMGSRKRALEHAKSCPAPSDASATSSGEEDYEKVKRLRVV